jgi:hypothetical protein
MTAVALPIVGYKKGLLTFAKEKALGEEGTNKGLVDSASTLLLGSHKDAYGNEKSVSEKTVDTLLGEGAYSSIKAGVGNVGADLGCSTANFTPLLVAEPTALTPLLT